MSSSSNHIWKECAGPGLGYWRCGISYGWNLTTCGSRYRNLAPRSHLTQHLTQLSHKLQPCLVRYKAWKLQIFLSTTASVMRLESFFFGGGVTWLDLVIWPWVTWTYNFQESCGTVVRTAMQKKTTVALRGSATAHSWEQKKRTVYSKATRKEVWQAWGNMTCRSIGRYYFLRWSKVTPSNNIWRLLWYINTKFFIGDWMLWRNSKGVATMFWSGAGADS